MSTSKFAVLAFFALCVGPIACASNTDDAAPPAETNDGADEELKASIIGETQNGKSVDVVLGRSFTIALSSNASTGYQWHVASVDKTLGQPKASTIPGDPSRPGAPGTQQFTWSTKSPLNLAGKHEITLEYQRPWAETAPPAKTFKVTINIAAATTAPKHCGGFAGLTCGDDEFCEYQAAAHCGIADQTGTCEKHGQFCPDVFNPVCGCDGKTYGNGCFANVGGASVAHAGSCAK